MFTRRLMLSAAGTMLLLLSASTAAAQDVVTMGPPPELRKNMDAFLKAFNSGSAVQYEAMAKATFAPAYYKRETAEARKAAYMKMVKEFGTIEIDEIERSGPDAPLQAFVKGSVKSGVFWIDLDEAHRISGIRIEAETMSDTITDAHRRH